MSNKSLSFIKMLAYVLTWKKDVLYCHVSLLLNLFYLFKKHFFFENKLLKETVICYVKSFTKCCPFWCIATIFINFFQFQIIREYFVHKLFPISVSFNIGFLVLRDNKLQWTLFSLSVWLFQWNCPSKYRKTIDYYLHTFTAFEFVGL